MNVNTRINFTGVKHPTEVFNEKHNHNTPISFMQNEDTISISRPHKKQSFFEKARNIGLPLALLSTMGIGAYNMKENGSLRDQNTRLIANLQQTEQELAALKRFAITSNTELGQSVQVLVNQTEEKIARVKAEIPVDLKVVIKKASPAAVGIKTVDGSGSGSIIKDKKGQIYVLTAAHVADNPFKSGTNEVFKISTYTGSDKTKPFVFEAPLNKDASGNTSRDTSCDLAVLKVPSDVKLPASVNPIELRDISKDPLQSGERVIVIGNPLGARDNVSAGIISNPERILNPINGTILIQIDAVVNPGNSGGMIVDDKGRLIGIAHALLRSSPMGDGNGMSIAIRVDQAQKFLKDNGIEI